jgi:hypothetical protein
MDSFSIFTYDSKAALSNVAMTIVARVLKLMSGT